MNLDVLIQAKRGYMRKVADVAELLYCARKLEFITLDKNRKLIEVSGNSPPD